MSLNIPKLSLYLRTDKKKKSGKMPLYVRFPRIDGKEPKFPIGNLEFLEEEWDNVSRRPLNNTDLKLIIDKEVNRIETEILDAVRHEDEITIDLLRKIVKNEKIDESQNASFYEYFNMYMQRQEKRGEMGIGTFKSYMTTLNSLKEFKKEIKIKDINEKLINDFDKFLINRGNESGKGDVMGSRYNRMKHLRAVISFVSKKGIGIENPFKTGDISISEYETNNIFLEKEEFKRLNKYYRKEMGIRTPEAYAMSMFLFSCLTALRISDILTLKWGHIDRSKNPWVINKTLEKKVGGKKVSISNPIVGYADTILDLCIEDYNDMENPESFVFPRMSPSKINKILQDTAEKVGIEKPLTFHSSRRTCATFFALEGMDKMTLMKLMGHTNFNTTVKYIKWSADLAREIAGEFELKGSPKSLIK